MHISEALKRLRLGETVWANFEGQRLQLNPARQLDGTYIGYGFVIAKWRRPGGLAICFAHDKDAGDRIVLMHRGVTRRTTRDDVYAVVAVVDRSADFERTLNAQIV